MRAAFSWHAFRGKSRRELVKRHRSSLITLQLSEMLGKQRVSFGDP